ncbi:restriction endonuclease subunit S [Streptomyces scabiei]|uniref:restriction endonuclease subunit S n=1 Tax=Streptomyces scabiei TaxID=1930 RepID=UPI00099B7DA5|nr:restriction endonuclease subunit S [Streptomyces scabiei]
MTTDSGVGPGGSGVEGDVTGGLPAGWVRATLGESGEWFGGGTPSKRNPEFWTDGTIPWLSPKDMREGVLSGTQDMINESALDASPVNLLPAGAVAVVVRSGILERKVPVAYVPFEVTLNQDMKAVVPHEGIDGRWLAFIIASQEQRILADCRKSGTTVASLAVSRLMELEISVPPVAEQHRIVAKLDEQMAYIAAGERALGAADGKGKKFLQVVLRDALRGDLVPEDLSEEDARYLVPDSIALNEGPWGIPDDWRWATIGKLFRVAVGSTPLRSNSAHWGGGVPWVSSGEVSFGRISFTRESISIDSIASPEDRIHPPGTVMIAMIGEGRTRGQVAVLDIAAAHNQNCASIRVSETEILPEFVYYFLMSRYEETRREASGGNQPALNKGKVESLLIPIPPLGTQRNIIARVQGLEEDLYELREAVADGWARASRLRNALLHSACTGALVSQEPDDEPASVPLDRIRAQRAAEVKPARRKRASRTTASAAPQASGRPVPSGTQEALPL